MRSEIAEILSNHHMCSVPITELENEAITEILSLLESKLPKEKVVGKDASTESGVGHWVLNQSARGFNACLADVKKQLEIG